ncbi:SDR family oxidoreductase [Hyphococcus flavus]|uniref:SDR family oxidoreductase n=1 Tax=Hyphococcus flavus TaxID=1866326 RepID=A0AAF0CF86_9PROT|nr:SDR family oxidoreductase [Hyphococcus flavus]WDI30613.1 SDR family oxidoreductase [Hyphococcus flavus]
MSTVLITGANRGIGLEFVKQYARDGWKVHACCRNPDKASELNTVQGDVFIHALDVTDHAAIVSLASDLAEPIDILVVNAGVGGRGEGDFGDYNYDVWKSVLDVNVYGSVATAEAFAPHVKNAKGKIAFISSKMGSIGDASGGAIAYRTSKTALNMAGKVVAAALAGEGVAVSIFHPGWVETDMGGPNALIKPDESVKGLRALIDQSPVTPSPRLLAYDGAEIPW